MPCLETNIQHAHWLPQPKAVHWVPRKAGTTYRGVSYTTRAVIVQVAVKSRTTTTVAW